jgi:hypothetical protein
MQAKDLHRHGHPREREGLSLSEYMHGHGVNLRHIGLLRSLLLKEVEAAAADAARSRSAVSAVDIDSYPDSLSISQDSYDGSQHVDRPLDTTESGRCAPMPSDRGDRGPSDGTHSGAPVGLTPALYALQSELFLEALCRTLKVVYLEATPTSVVSYRRACPSYASKRSNIPSSFHSY